MRCRKGRACQRHPQAISNKQVMGTLRSTRPERTDLGLHLSTRFAGPIELIRAIRYVVDQGRMMADDDVDEGGGVAAAAANAFCCQNNSPKHRAKKLSSLSEALH